MLNVFVVDDDQDLLEMVTLMLEASGMNVKSFHTGALLHQSLDAVLPDILLMDIFIGDNDGRDLCRRLKTEPGYSGFPIILYSAGDVTAASITASGADFFIRKPFEMSDLLHHIHQQIEEKSR